MHPIDIIIFIVYLVGMLGIGYYFLRKNKDADDYYVGGRNMSKWHVGISVVATDVGGGFSIGLGGLGFIMGIAGSWMLFTGLIGAWLSAVFLIPRIYKLGAEGKLRTFPEIFNHFFDHRVALAAGIISGIGYLGFTSSQLLAGAKLATATFPALELKYALVVMGIIAVVYTVMGGLKAVIFTDSIQWAILLGGLIFIGIPLAYFELGGIHVIRQSVQPELLSITNVSWSQLVNWAVTIIPIWFVGMTLYQRIYACRSVKDAQKAWYIAGVFEWPLMAFMGVTLGMFARVALDIGLFEHLGYTNIDNIDAEMGLPLLLRTILPPGLTGIMMAAYFSAILSTADSCLMASSGNFVSDLMAKIMPIKEERLLRLSQWVTLAIGTLALILAATMTNVLELMLMSYAFMVSGLLVPVLSVLILKKNNSNAALAAMLVGGGTTLALQVSGVDLPLELDPNIFGISASALIFALVYKLIPEKLVN
ncbi:MAG: sodium:solute symporter family protein [Chitinophagales bacterium]